MLVTHTHNPRHQRGFTILELMIASTVFMVVLLVIAIGVISFTNSYYKGITASKTQATARSVINLIASSIQLGQQVTLKSVAGGVSSVCVDNTYFVYQTGVQVTDTAPQAGKHQGYHGLVESTGGDCSGMSPVMPGSGALPASSRELLEQHMRLGALTVTQSGNTYTIRVKVLYGDDDLLTATTPAFTWANEACQGGIEGEQFCAVSDLTTTVEKRML